MPITKIDNKILHVFVAVGSLIERNGSFLFVQEKKPQAYGKWSLPAGKAEKEYSLKENAIREIKEETGYDAEIIKEIKLYHQEGDKSIKHVYLAKIIGGKIKIPSDEILDVKWFTLDEINRLNNKGLIRNYWMYEVVRWYVKTGISAAR